VFIMGEVRHAARKALAARKPQRARKPLAAWSLTGSALVVLAAALVLLGLNASLLHAGKIGFYGLLSVGVLAYAGAGGLIARRVPGNAIGWLLGLAGLTLAVAMLTEQCALYGLATAPGAVPAAKVAGVLSGAAVELTVILLAVLVLLFPDGRLPSPRWRPVLWALAVVAAALVAQQFQAGTRITGGITNALAGAGVAYPNPLGVLPRNGWFSGLLAGVFFLALVTVLLALASVFVRRRGASPERRQQLAWLGYVGVMTVVWFALLFLAGLLVRGPDNDLVTSVFWGLMFLTPVAGIPVACVVAVLKYRLYDLGRVVSRTVTYAIVTGLLVGVYAGLVLLATQVVKITSPVAVAGATLAAAALFGPLRSRVQHKVDRRFNRARYDAERLLAAFAARLTEELDADAVTEDLARSVHTALEPAHVSVWLSDRRLAASRGTERDLGIPW
jgi:hypothetical protein